jgi:sulfoxide reductase heme-binding subunit YedZ
MSLLQERALNGWPLFILISALTVVILAAGMLLRGPSTPEASQSLVRLAGLIATPLIYLVFATAPLARLFPSSVSRWLLSNRRYIGLSFAGVFTWHLVFLLALFALHQDYYMQTVHEPSDVYLGSISYLLLIAMAASSLFVVRRRMRPGHWRLLHRVGIWYFWLAVWVTYTEIAFSDGSTFLSVAYASLGLLVLILRVAAYLTTRTDNLSEANELL